MKKTLALLATTFIFLSCENRFLLDTTSIQKGIFKDEKIIENALIEIIPNNKIHITKHGHSNQAILFVTIKSTNRLDENQIIEISQKITDIISGEFLDSKMYQTIEYNYIHEVVENDILKKQDISYNITLDEK